MYRAAGALAILLGLSLTVAAADRKVTFTVSNDGIGGSAELRIGPYISNGFTGKYSGITLDSRFNTSETPSMRNGPFHAWFEKDESGIRFLVRPNNSWLMKNCSKLAEQIDVHIRGFRANGKEAGYHEGTASASCHNLNVSGYEFDQYPLVTLYEADELFDYFWDYSGVEVAFSLGRIDDEDLDFYLMFSAKNFRKNYKDLR